MPYKIFVCNIPYSMTSIDLTGLFSTYGKVNFALSARDRNTNAPKGYGFIDMETEEDMLNAIKALNGRKIADREIKVSRAKDRPDIERRPKADIVGEGTCLLCGHQKVLAGFFKEQGVCASCAKIMSNIHFHYGKAQALSGGAEETTIECILRDR